MKPRHLLAIFMLIMVLLILGSLPGDASATASPSQSKAQVEAPLASASPTWTPTPTITSTPTSICPAAWRLIPSQNLPGANTLFGVVAVAWNDIWAVGSGNDSPLIQHWNGAQWALASPTPMIGFSHRLDSVDAVSTSDVWAVGWYEGSAMGTLTMHWNGSAWSWIQSPNGTGYYNELLSVSARAANDVWAVGYQITSGPTTNHTLTEHWNGSTWSVIPSPDMGGNGYLRGVAALASNDVWAVGNYVQSGVQQPLILRWDGSAWNIISTPTFPGGGHLQDVVGVAANDVWAVGDYTPSGSPQSTFTMHWNGAVWSVFPSPSPGTSSNHIYAVDALSVNDVWAVGTYLGPNPSQTLTMHWNGTAWSVVTSPNPSSTVDFLGVALVAPNDAWAVGGTLPDGGNFPQTLIEHYSYSGCETATPTAIISPTPTLAPPSVTPTSTCPPAWNTVPSQGITGASYLDSVEVIGPNDVWAVGGSRSGSDDAILEHWNGAQWSLVPYQHPGFADRLHSVSAVASNDVWAVGWYEGSFSGTFTEHWNGASWSWIQSPNVGYPTWNELFGVSARATNDVWAVGSSDGFGGGATEIMHWDGSAWSLIPSPSPGSSGILRGVSALASDDAWAVGTYSDGGTTRAIALHWNGTAWSVSPLPAFPADSALYSVVARAANDVWVVGSYSGQTLILRWTGSWSIYPSPNVGAEPNALYGVDALALNDAWAVGKYQLSGSDQTLTMHWNGTTWSLVPSTNPELVNSLAAVSLLAPNNVWAVGLSNNEVASQGDTLTEHYASQPGCGTITPTLTPTPTGTSLASATPTACSVSYTYTVSEGQVDVIAPGATPLISDCHNCAAEVRLPFAFTFYGHTYNNVSIQSFGNIQFTTSNSSPHTCPFPFPQMGPSIMPYWSEFQTYWVGSGDGPCVQNYGSPCGVYTTITGSPPNRVYNIQWIGVLYGSNHETVNFQARLHETTGVIDFVYANGVQFGNQGAVGIQDGAGHFTSYACDTTANLQNIQIVWTPVYAPCATVTGTPPTATPIRTATATNTPVATPTQCTVNYSYTTGTDNLEQGQTLLTGSQCGLCVVPITLPFPFRFYGQTYTSANVSTIGNLQFVTASTASNTCPLDNPQLGPAIMPNWDGLFTMSSPSICHDRVGRDCGIYTHVRGSAPNRVFNIEWLALHIGSNTYIINFNMRLYESTGVIDFVYGQILPPPGGISSTVGIQNGAGSFVSYACNVAGSIYQGLLIRWTPTDCPPTPTPSPTITRTSTPAPPTYTPTACPEYAYSVSAGSIVQGTSLVLGSQCGHCVVPVALPFSFTFYGQTYTTANVANYGNLQFTTASTSNNSCPPGYPDLGPAIMPNWDDSIDTSFLQPCQSQLGRDCGIYTSVSGSAPNRIFNIEWVGRSIQSNHYVVNFELRLYEGTGVFDFVYGTLQPPPPGHFGTIGIQSGGANNSFINYACHQDNSIYSGLLIRWMLPACAPTTTPTPTGTALPTATLGTPGPGTATPVPSVTSTVCPLTFSDVPADSTFYPFIRCLACRGIIAGYDDGTFRPGNDITRGQIAKMVSNAAGFSEDPGPQIYEDVPVGSPFYDWVNRLSNRGHMGGYQCGLIPEEPCISPSNLPYFRPNQSATRGQLAKIVANAAGLSGDPTGLFYEDVPEGHPFYAWIMRLTDLGVMSGYECGGVGEPCDDENRPYFRPFNNVTRGQASKIAANTFYPNCQTPNK